MTKIKLCGMTRLCDIDAVNELRPEYVGFVFAPGSKRRVTPDQAAELSAHLTDGVAPVGVFVNEPIDNVCRLTDSGVIDVALSQNVPEGVRRLAGVLTERLRAGELDVFAQRLPAQDGSLISDGATPLSSLEILKMDKLAASVAGHIPGYDELLPLSRPLVRSLGIYREELPLETDERARV